MEGLKIKHFTLGRLLTLHNWTPISQGAYWFSYYAWKIIIINMFYFLIYWGVVDILFLYIDTYFGTLNTCIEYPSINIGVNAPINIMMSLWYVLVQPVMEDYPTSTAGSAIINRFCWCLIIIFWQPKSA